jgi:hypothetical protein
MSVGIKEMRKLVMPDWAIPLLFVVGYVILMKWVLPGMGVST